MESKLLSSSWWHSSPIYSRLRGQDWVLKHQAETLANAVQLIENHLAAEAASATTHEEPPEVKGGSQVEREPSREDRRPDGVVPDLKYQSLRVPGWSPLENPDTLGPGSDKPAVSLRGKLQNRSRWAGQGGASSSIKLWAGAHLASSECAFHKGTQDTNIMKAPMVESQARKLMPPNLIVPISVNGTKVTSLVNSKCGPEP